MLVTFDLTVTSDFWEHPRDWPKGCRPIVFSVDAVMRNSGTLQVPLHCAIEVERLLRDNPHVVTVQRAPLPFPLPRVRETRRAA